jgi:hypothetical protein
MIATRLNYHWALDELISMPPLQRSENEAEAAPLPAWIPFASARHRLSLLTA